jgi:periplasmic copper chaperone A
VKIRRMTTRRIRVRGRAAKRAAVVAGLTVGAIVVAAGPALAHIEPEPNRVKPGSEATVEFTPEHGCGEDSPTTKLTFQVPKGVKDASGIAPTGWETSATTRRVVFEGGSLPYHDSEAFGITFTAPDTTTVLAWKVVQRCEEGTVRWIETGHDAEHPAPLVGVGKKPPVEDDDH